MRETLVLLPGLLCDERLFAAQVPALSAEAEVTVADLARDAGIAAMADRVLTAAPDRFALAGLSMGGYVAFEILRNAPERVTRLALLDTQATADREEALSRRRGLMELAEKGEFRGVTPRLLPLFIHRDRLGDEALTGTVQAMAEVSARPASCASRRRSWAGPTAARACRRSPARRWCWRAARTP
jgi:pimeloyl-ACP methyl ester carboxylesterase